MRLRVLVGEGGHIMGPTALFAAAAIATSLAWPSVLRMGTGRAGLVIGIALRTVGVPLWIASVVQFLVNVPKKRLITTGPFALMLHPLFTCVALLVIPGCSLALDTWVGFAIGAVLYLFSRIYSPREAKLLTTFFP